MSESSSEPAPRYACHCTFTVSATLRRSTGLRGVVDEHVGARVAVEVGEPERGAARERRAPRTPPGADRSRPRARPSPRSTPARAGRRRRRAGTVGWYAGPRARLGPRVVAGARRSSPCVVRRVGLHGRPWVSTESYRKSCASVRDARRGSQEPGPRCSHGRYDARLRAASTVAAVAAAADAEPTRRTGRPRRAAPARSAATARARSSPPPAGCSPSAASSGTTMAEIARRSGLQQSSLYYYFRNKEQRARRDRGGGEPGAARARRRGCGADGGPPAVQLYRIIRADVVALCALPYDLNEIHRLAGPRPATRSPGTGRSGSSWSTR